MLQPTHPPNAEPQIDSSSHAPQDHRCIARLRDLLDDTIRIRRVIRVNNEFNVYAEMHLEGARFRPLLDIPLEVLSGKNLRIFIHERFNVPTFRAEHRVTTTRLSAETAALLGVPSGSVAMDVKALSYGFRGAPASYQWMVVPENPYEMEFLG